MINNLHVAFTHVLSAFSLGSVYMPAAAGEAMRYGKAVPHDMPALVSILLIVAGIALIALSLVILVLVAKWKVYEKAKQPGWAVFVPVYGSVKMLEITSRPLWFVVLLFIPFVNVVLGIMLSYRLARNFGRGGWFALGLVCLPFIFYPILGFGSSTYKNVFPKALAMSEAVKWSLIGLAFWGLSMVVLAAMGSSQTPARMPLSIIQSDYSGVSDGDGVYATDGVYVYRDSEVLAGADPETFRLEGDYAMDASHVFYAGSILRNADRDSFVVLSGGYATDAAHVYFEGEVLPGVQSAAFMPLGDSGYATDMSHVYYDGILLPKIDRSAFVVENGTVGKDLQYDAKDAKHYYYAGEIVK